ncbi:MAG: hypothetical protein Q8941_08605 [Bacteroidota bacterium]|nr:hypothetical protein [Bacteroidota bacterium]
MAIRCIILLTTFLFAVHSAHAQLPYGLVDGRDGDLRCQSCDKLITQMPPEVLFGVDIHEDGQVYFSMNNSQWFEKIFASSTSGISVDIVSKDRYNCNNALQSGSYQLRGHLLRPLYKENFKQNRIDLQDGHVTIKIGTLPPNLLNKELEGNLVIVNGSAICYYTNFVNIDRNVWDLLPMGLYTDTLVNRAVLDTGMQNIPFTYTRKIQVGVPFSKGKTTFSSNDIKPLYDSLNLKDFIIQKIEIRAYSSVEGPERVNIELMKGRANAMIRALQQFQPSMKRIKIVSAENWLEFFRDIKNSEFRNLSTLSKAEVKLKLLDKAVAEKLEPILAGHRKAIVTIYLDSKTEASGIPGNNIISAFSKAIVGKDIQRARIIQKELVNRILDNKLPEEYLDRLEIPMSRDYCLVLNDREIYKYLLRTTSEYEALENFLQLKKLDPSNGRINYNICTLRFFLWQFGDSVDTKSLLQDISALEKQGIDNSLIKRMMINYHILKCSEYITRFNYSAKDQSLLFIKNTYPALKLTDEELFSLAKYFSFYAHQDWAEALIGPRIDKIDVSEDIVFYYVNLGFYHPLDYGTDQFKNAILNAINLNRERFCEFFRPINKGGASMQLLENEGLKKMYCESCSLNLKL